MKMDDKKIYNLISEIVTDMLNKQGLLLGHWHLGTVDQVLSSTKLKVFVDGSDVSQTVSCNPDVTFATGNHIWVVFINGNSRDKFAISKRAV
jgi:hypothetical protein